MNTVNDYLIDRNSNLQFAIGNLQYEVDTSFTVFHLKAVFHCYIKGCYAGRLRALLDGAKSRASSQRKTHCSISHRIYMDCRNARDTHEIWLDRTLDAHL